MLPPIISIIASVYRGEKYLSSFLEHVAQITNPEECELILVHNDPTDQELKILDTFVPGKLEVVHLVVAREPLYSSWNRAINAARGKYIAIWNIDDVRAPDALQIQAHALKSNHEAAIVYGNYTVVRAYNAQEGELYRAPDFSHAQSLFYKFHCIGPFPMWRKELHDRIGYFDEQFRLVADLDFQIRAAKVAKLLHVDVHLGYYLEGTPDNLSSNYNLQDAELTVLHLRYGNYDRIYLTNLWTAFSKYSILKYTWAAARHHIKDWATIDYKRFILHIPLVAVSMYRFPRHLARKYLRPYARKYLRYHTSKLFGNSKGQLA
jgi:glycosyltransferase involved in cell wall biosynthesis